MEDRKFELYHNIERYLAILSKLLENEDNEQLQTIIVNSKPRVQTEWSYDNWDGGIYGHALFLEIPGSIYLDIVNDKVDFQNQIKERLNKVHDIRDEFFEEVFFEMEVEDDHDWRRNSSHLIKSNRVVPEPAANRIWKREFFRVFLSHKAEVKKETSVLKDILKIFGVSCFVAHEDIHPTKEWQSEIENALHTMDAFVALMTKDFHDSLWTDQEIGFAFGRGVSIIPVKLGKDPYGFIGKFQALSCTWETAHLEILKILIKKEPMINAYINAVKNCKNFDEANHLSTLLPFIEKLSKGNLENLINAFNKNDQVNSSYGFIGSKPGIYGYGLLPLLHRNTEGKYKISEGSIIQVKG